MSQMLTLPVGSTRWSRQDVARRRLALQIGGLAGGLTWGTAAVIIGWSLSLTGAANVVAAVLLILAAGAVASSYGVLRLRGLDRLWPARRQTVPRGWLTTHGRLRFMVEYGYLMGLGVATHPGGSLIHAFLLLLFASAVMGSVGGVIGAAAVYGLARVMASDLGVGLLIRRTSDADPRRLPALANTLRRLALPLVLVAVVVIASTILSTG